MKILRRLAAVLGCFAVLAAGLPTVALASAPLTQTTPSGITAPSEPCQHCPDCATPCKAAKGDCLQACLAAPPVLAVPSAAIPAMVGNQPLQPADATNLHSLSRPPDPFPPRT